MDINAGKVLEARATPLEIGMEIFDRVIEVAGGTPSTSEELGHQEFILTYKQFEPIGPACLPV
jgi:altronate hydrolase